MSSSCGLEHSRGIGVCGNLTVFLSNLFVFVKAPAGQFLEFERLNLADTQSADET